MKIFPLFAVWMPLAVGLHSRTVELNGEGTTLDPFSVVFDNAGTMFEVEYVRSNRVLLVEVSIPSRGGNALRVMEPGGRIRTMVNASGAKGYSGDGGPAVDATMNGPKHLAADPQGRILTTDTENHCIRRFDPAAGTIELVAGVRGVRGGDSSGNPLEIRMNRPHDSRAHHSWLYVADSENDRVIWFPYSEV